MSSLTEEECSICLEMLKNEIAHLSCNHFFHYRCIGEWINKNNKNNKEILCPICNQPFEIINIYLPKSVDINNKKSPITYSHTRNESQQQQAKKTCVIL